MDTKDQLLISQLRKNGRQSFSEISRITNIPTSTVFDKIKKFESNLIKRYTTLFDYGLLGYPIKANFVITPHGSNLHEIKDFLLGSLQVNSLATSDDQNFLVEAVFRNNQSLMSFRKMLDEFHPLAAESYIIDKELKHEAFMVEDYEKEEISN